MQVLIFLSTVLSYSFPRRNFLSLNFFKATTFVYLTSRLKECPVHVRTISWKKWYIPELFCWCLPTWKSDYSSLSEIILEVHFQKWSNLITLTSFEKQNLNTNQQLNQEPKEGTWWQFHPREITETNPFCSEQKSQRKHGRLIRSHPSLRSHFHSLTDTEKMPVAESQQWHWQGDFMEDSPNRNPVGKNGEK